ncbi:acyl-CoA desaturase [Frigoriglobus tundricola]|uniref:acyl-CoA desaturase n=1 Tax=Frigoriglobus tundricola TaxID=2774151 RepID=UPI001D0721DC|nr:fatty acid desaturase [Frigoriglobus tundricola]
MSTSNLPTRPEETGKAAAALPAPQYSLRRRVIAWAGTFIGVTVPLAGLIVAIVLTWGWGFTWVDFGLLVGMYLLTMSGVTIGFHRLFTHRSFQTFKPIQVVLGALGSMSFQGPLLDWVGRHRLHHQHSDHEGDPHSPYPHGPGLWGLFRGFWHSHIGWAFAPMPDGLDRYAGDLRRDKLILWVSNLFPLWAFLGVFIPAAIGYAFGGWTGALTGFLWGGLVRILLGHHATWCVNSVCHLWGKKPYNANDESRNNLFVGIIALGEGWHNNHHAFPSSARHGLRWWQIDWSYIVIRLMVLCGLAWKVRLPTPHELNMRGETQAPLEPAAG